MYNIFSDDYDRFVNWPERLAYELPFLEKLLETPDASPVQPRRILDAACGTGMHTLALAERGWQTVGTDLSVGMIAVARQNAARRGCSVPFLEAGFGQIAAVCRQAGLLPFDGVVCLGNSLPHVLTLAELTAALVDFATCLRPGGVLVIQNRSFEAVMAQQNRWMEPQSYQEGDKEWLFLRFYDFLADGLLNFNILTLTRRPAQGWKQALVSTRLRPILQAELATALPAAGFDAASWYGNMEGAALDVGSSPNLILRATRL